MTQSSDDAVPSRRDTHQRVAVRALMEAHWRAPGFTVPNDEVYPWQWLWDSAFHAVIWAALGRTDRAIAELRSTLATQSDDGFVPHVNYHGEDPHPGFWGRAGTSSITQPPMYGHALAVLREWGLEVPSDLVRGAATGLRHLFDTRSRIDGLVSVVHPWETGADDSPRWDHWVSGYESPFVAKGEILASVERAVSGAPVANPSFACAPASFNALLAFNARELHPMAPEWGLATDAEELSTALDRRWDAQVRTWVDAGDAAATSGRVRTLDALLPVLSTNDDAAVSAVREDLLDERAHAAPFGPAGVHRGEPAFSPGTYWRGSAWPQLTYLLGAGFLRRGDTEAAARLRRLAWAGAEASGFAEHHDPLVGSGLGARPQSWSALPLVLDRLLEG